MATEPHFIDVDLKRKTQFSTPVVTQNDTDVVFIMRISDDGRTSPDLLNNFSKVTLTSERWDRESFFTLGSKVDGTNEVEFRLGTKELELVGKVTASVQFYSTDGRKSSSHFRYQVEKDLTGEYVPTETEAGLIETVLIDGPEIIGAAQKATQDTIQSLEVFNTDKAESIGELTTTIEENRVEWKPAVATVAERDTKYPNPVNGWTVRVTGETAIYKYSKNAWIKTDQYNPAAVDGLYTQLAETAKKSEVQSLVTNKAEIAYVDSKVSAIDRGYGETYATLAALQSAFPTGNTKRYVVSADGKWYFWNGSAWAAGGVFQGIGIAAKAITPDNLSDNVTQVSIDYVPTYSGEKYGYFTNQFSGTTALKSDNSDKQLQINGNVSLTNPLVFTAGTIKDTAYTNTKGEISVGMRLKVDARQSHTQRVLVIGNGAGANVFEMCIGASGALIFTPNAMNSGVTLELGKWYSIGFKLTPTSLVVLVDGVQVKTFPLAATLNLNGTLMIGALHYGYVNQFVGQMSNVLIYNSVLSDGDFADYHKELATDTNNTIYFKKNNIWRKVPIPTIEPPAPVEVVLPLKTGRFMHISCDDFINVFKDITANAYPSIFGNSTLAFLKTMNEKYGMVFSAYCFFENPDKTFTLDQMPATYAAEFKANSHWLKFGFHGYSESTDYRDTNITAATAKSHYDLVMAQLFRICGGSYSLDYVPRIHFYGSTLDKTIEWKKTDAGINGLLYPEDIRNGYYLNADQRAYLEKNDRWYDTATGLYFFSTDIRLEYITNAMTTLNTRKADLAFAKRMNDLVIFTHELFITESVTKTKIEDCCKFAKENGYEFDYPMNRL